MSEPWICLIGSYDKYYYYVEDVLWIDGSIFFSGYRKISDKREGFVGCVSENGLKYFKLIKGVRATGGLCYCGGRVFVGGWSFLGCFDFYSGRFKWIKGSKVGLAVPCLCRDLLFAGGGSGKLALLKENKVVAEKELSVKNSIGEWWYPSIDGVCCLGNRYIVAGDLPKLVSKNSEYDFFVCFLNERLIPEWCTGFGGPKEDETPFIDCVCCDNRYIYFCGCTKSTSFSEEDIVVACLSKNGELEWCRVYGSKLNDGPNCIRVDDKYLYIAGYAKWSKNKGYGCILVADKKNGEIVDGKLVGSVNHVTSFLNAKLVGNDFLLCGWTTIHYSMFLKLYLKLYLVRPYSGLIMFLPRDYTGETRAGKEKIIIEKWIPKEVEWWPKVVNLESKTVNRKVFAEEYFSIIEESPRVIFSGKWSLKPVVVETETVRAPVVREAIDYFDLLSVQLNLVKELKVSSRHVFSFKCDLSGFSGVWRCVKLGCGGWGCSYFGEQDGCRVVFKVPRGYESIIEENACPTVSSKLMERIVSEAEVVKSLDHPNILRLLDYGRDYPLLVYEFADYGSLEYQLREGWEPSLKEVVLLGIQIGDALRYIHGRGLVHCDIKPSNIFFVHKIAKLGDFSSLVKLLSKTSSHSKFAYTPGFAAPEQRYADLRRRVIELGYENRIDVYQLGNLLLYLLTGESIDGEDIYDQKLVKDVISQVEYSELEKLIRLTLNDKAWERPSVDEVVKYLVKIYRGL